MRAHTSRLSFSVVALAVTILLASCSSLLGIDPLQEASTADEITSFEFLATTNSGLPADVTATIDGTTVTATAPFGTDVTALKPTFVTTGATVTADGVEQTSGVTAVDFTSPVTYVVTAASGTSKTFTVTVTVAESSAKELTAYAFLAVHNAALSADVTATINGTTITATVPFGTDVTALDATFSTTGTSVTVGSVAQTSSATTNDFTGAVVYRVVAADATTKDFTVTVTVAPDPAKELTAFSFLTVHNPGLSANVTATINGTTITATVPFATDVTALKATFSTTGASVSVAGATQTSGGTPNDFTAPVIYRVTAADTTTKDFTVTVTVAPDPSKDITAFSFLTVNNAGLGADVTAMITGTAIAATVPFGTTVTALKATFSTTGASVSVGATTQVSGVTPNNFSGPVTYHVTAADGSTKDFTVTVTVAPSPAKDITAFSFLTVNNPGLPSNVTATITGTAIAATVPFGTDVTALEATFTTTGASVKVGATTQTSGATPNNFTSAVTYRVTAADTSTKDFTVTVSIAANPAKDITAFSFLKANNAGLTADITASISGTSITANVPVGTAVIALKATFTITGASVKVGATTQTSGVTPNNFTAPVIYRVTAADGSTKDFTVTVTARDVDFSAKIDFTTGTGPTSVAVGDFNGDGRPDFAVANENSNTVSVFLDTTAPGATTATFATKVDFATGGGASDPAAIAIGDLNGDGKPDLVVACTNLVTVFINTTAPGATTPSFAAHADTVTGLTAVSLALRDLNGDGLLDVAAANLNANNVSVLLNTTAPGATTPSFAAHIELAVGTNPESVAIADLNGDGQPDLVTANLSSNDVSVLLNTTAPGATTASFATKASFSTGAATGPFGVAVGDLNGDGKPDLAVADNGAAKVSVFLNTTVTGATTPNFAAHVDFATGGAPGSAAPFAITAGDFDGDGLLDLAVAINGPNTLAVLLNTTAPGSSTPSFAAHTDFPIATDVQSLAVGDFNGDGKPDLALANTAGGGGTTASVLLNTTSPSGRAFDLFAKTDFTADTQALQLTSGDIDGDGRPDLVVANADANTVSVFLNTTTLGATTGSVATRVSFAAGVSPRSVALGDFNGDGKLDLAVANTTSGTISIFFNTSTVGTVTLATRVDLPASAAPIAAAVRDLNGDGKLDIAVANDNSNSVSVILNTTSPGATSPSFAAKVDFPTGANPLGVSIKDLNGDGKPDLAVANFGPGANSVSILLNTTTTGSGTPSFTPKVDFATGANPLSIAIGDINGDGKPDLAVATQNVTTISVLLGTTATGATTPTFASKVDFAVGTSPRSVVLCDLDGDGLLDLAVSNQGSNSISTLKGTTVPGAAVPTFAPKVDFTTGVAPSFVTSVDLNGDGRPDLVTANGVPTNSISILLAK